VRKQEERGDQGETLKDRVSNALDGPLETQGYVSQFGFDEYFITGIARLTALASV
jgi:hypothetical protein